MASTIRATQWEIVEEAAELLNLVRLKNLVDRCGMGPPAGDYGPITLTSPMKSHSQKFMVTLTCEAMTGVRFVALIHATA